MHYNNASFIVGLTDETDYKRSIFSVINEMKKEKLTMDKIYKKNEVTFAIICIVIYVAGTSIMESIAESIGVFMLPSMIFHIIFTAVLLVWQRTISG